MKWLFLLLTVSSFAQNPESLELSKERYVVSTKTRIFYTIEQLHWTVSENCVKAFESGDSLKAKADQLKCQAVEALKSKSKPNVQIVGGQNPGALICKAVGGDVVYALDGKNQVSMCRFSDDSMATNGSLTHALFR